MLTATRSWCVLLGACVESFLAQAPRIEGVGRGSLPLGSSDNHLGQERQSLAMPVAQGEALRAHAVFLSHDLTPSG